MVKDTTAPTNGKAAEPLLDLRTLAPSDYLRIDGETYPLRSIDSFGIRRRAEFIALMGRIGALEAKGAEATEDDEREYVIRLREACAAIIPDADEEVIDKLDPGQMVDLAGSFFAWLGQNRGRIQLMRKLQALTTENPSPDSPASTVPASGSSRPRSR